MLFIVEYWRRTLDGYEYSSNRIFSSKDRARRNLILSGYRIVDKEEIEFKKNGMKAIITEREVE